MTSINKKILLFFLAIAISKMQLVNAMQQNIIYSQVQRPYVDQTGTLNVPTHVNEIFDEDFIGDLSLCNRPIAKCAFDNFTHLYIRCCKTHIFPFAIGLILIYQAMYKE